MARWPLMKGQSPIESIQVPQLTIRADVQTANVEQRTVDLVFSTGAAVERYDWMTGKRYVEKLSMDPASIRLDRLNSGASLLNAHGAYSLSDVIGAVVPSSAKVVGKQGRATVRFSKRTDVEPIFQDVQDGIIRFVSVGYRVYKYEESTPKEGALPVRTAVDWEPMEISLVPIPADASAVVRKDEKAVTNQCELVRAAVDTADGDRDRRLRLAKSL